jgi:hypothetical protein
MDFLEKSPAHYYRMSDVLPELKIKGAYLSPGGRQQPKTPSDWHFSLESLQLRFLKNNHSTLPSGSNTAILAS